MLADAASMKKRSDYAVVTPYYKESRDTIEKCIASVAAQTVAADHFLVADGFAQDWIDTREVRHFKLDTGHADFGNTPRGIGALLAASEQYHGIAFLDADCWLDANHVELCRRTAGNDPIDFVIANRRMVAPDGTVLAVPEEPDHVDTNCLFLLEGAFHTLHHWVLQPRVMAPLDDRVIWTMLKGQGLNWRRTAAVTVNYFCLWRNVYVALGLEPPVGAKPAIGNPIPAYLASLDARGLEILRRRTGITFKPKV